jgi:hypothetical protein
MWGSKSVGEGEERWLPVVGYEGFYEVSDQGRVRSRYRVLKQARNTQKRLIVCLSKQNKARVRLVHHLVLEAFVGLRPSGTEACHWNDIADDNRLANLRWDTHEANCADIIRNDHRLTRNTHCRRGHALTSENVYIRPGNPRSRECRVCKASYRKNPSKMAVQP